MRPPRPEPAPLSEFDPVIVIPGVGEVFSRLLGRSMGIVTLGDLARTIPARYEDRSEYVAIAQLAHGESQCFQGVVRKVSGTLLKVFYLPANGLDGLLSLRGVHRKFFSKGRRFSVEHVT